MASGSDSSNSSAERPCSSDTATFWSSAYEEGSTVKECALCETRMWKKMDLDLGACKECRAAERERVMLDRRRIQEEMRQVVVEGRQMRTAATELLARGSPSGCEKESGRSFVVSRRDIAELVCRLEENETDGSSVGERVDNILALWDAMDHPSYCRLDAGLKNMDWIQILGTFGLQVAEPVSQDPSESFVRCILQWLVREELILPPLEEEEQRKNVRHFFKREHFLKGESRRKYPWFSWLSFPISLDDIV